MRSMKLSLVLVAALAAAGCAETTETQQRVGTGAAAGAATGAVIGSFTGSAGAGALVGGAVGAGGGYIYDQNKKKQESAYREGYKEGAQR